MTSILFIIVRIFQSLFNWYYLKNEKLFRSFFFHFWNLQQILNIFKNKKVVIANVFSKLQNVKDLIRPLSKKRRFRTSFDSQHIKVSQILAKSAWERFCHIFHHCEGKWCRKYLPQWNMKS